MNEQLKCDYSAGPGYAGLKLMSPFISCESQSASPLSRCSSGHDAAGAIKQHTVIVDCGLGIIASISAGAQATLRHYFKVDPAETSAVPPDLDRWLTAERKVVASHDTPQPLWVRSGASVVVVRLAQSTKYVAVILLDEITPATVIATDRIEEFTRREKEVLKWICEGKRDREIGTILGLSTRTVGKHLEHVFQKLGVETRTAAARAASELGIVAEVAREEVYGRRAAADARFLAFAAGSGRTV
jgi:DNA-binding CsgD family transcriptional regulator